MPEGPKLALLKRRGFIYDFRRMIYYNPRVRKVFSAEAVEDHDLRWIYARLREPPRTSWTFYFNDPPSADVRGELIRYLSGVQ